MNDRLGNLIETQKVIIFFFFFSSISCFSMGEGKRQMSQGPCNLYGGDLRNKDQWAIMEGGDENDAYNIIPSTPSSSLEDSTISNESSTSTDMADDATSSNSSYSSSSQSSAPLYNLSELVAHLPIKRGLSKFYQGKSESFTSVSSVRSVEDLAKKENPYRRKMKACKSHGGGLDIYKSFTLPKPTISKKTSRGSFLLSQKTCFEGKTRFGNLNETPKKF